MRHGKVFDLEDQAETGRRGWAKVATADGRQFHLRTSHDGSSVVSIIEDKTPDDDVHKVRSATVALTNAISTAAEQATGKGNLTSLEIDINNSDTLLWQIGTKCFFTAV